MDQRYIEDDEEVPKGYKCSETLGKSKSLKNYLKNKDVLVIIKEN